MTFKLRNIFLNKPTIDLLTFYFYIKLTYFSYPVYIVKSQEIQL